MASVRFRHENLGEDKHVESVLVHCLDEGSNPSISTTGTISRSLKPGSSAFVVYNRNSQSQILDQIEKLWRSVKSMAFVICGIFNIAPFVQVKSTAPFRAAA